MSKSPSSPIGNSPFMDQNPYTNPTEATATINTSLNTNPDSPVVRRALETNRFANQSKRRDWERSKEASIEVCQEFIRDFVQCTEGKTFSVVWKCKAQNAYMTKCMQTFMATKDPKAAYAIGLEMKQAHQANQ